MTDPRFFGYGSLVNLDTHDYPGAQPARLSGWRRAWVQTRQRDVAFLSVVPDAGCTIAGMVAHMPGADWGALDLREAAYARQMVSVAQDQQSVQTALYVVPHEEHARDGTRASILLSYLDVVVQGYLRAFGPVGAEEFFATTQNWDRPVLDDRDDPVYPRHQVLSGAETDCVNAYLARSAAVVKQR